MGFRGVKSAISAIATTHPTGRKRALLRQRIYGAWIRNLLNGSRGPLGGSCTSRWPRGWMRSWAWTARSCTGTPGPPPNFRTAGAGPKSPTPMHCWRGRRARSPSHRNSRSPTTILKRSTSTEDKHQSPWIRGVDQADPALALRLRRIPRGATPVPSGRVAGPAHPVDGVQPGVLRPAVKADAAGPAHPLLRAELQPDRAGAEGDGQVPTSTPSSRPTAS
jgi:hypothetical protein